ncbi:MAG: hypothetical protein ACLU33_00250 [Christensenellales bacterium]
MRRFINKIKGICEKNKRVAMFVDMDGTINEYEVYSEKTLSQQMEDRYMDTAPVQPIIDVLKEINDIPNIDLYILSLSRTNKLTEKKKLWLEKYIDFIPKTNWIILTKENGEYNKENRDFIKSLKMKEKLNEYDHFIFLDDDHKILKGASETFKEKINVLHISSVFV